MQTAVETRFFALCLILVILTVVLVVVMTSVIQAFASDDSVLYAI